MIALCVAPFVTPFATVKVQYELAGSFVLPTVKVKVALGAPELAFPAENVVVPQPLVPTELRVPSVESGITSEILSPMSRGAFDEKLNATPVRAVVTGLSSVSLSYVNAGALTPVDVAMACVAISFWPANDNPTVRVERFGACALVGVMIPVGTVILHSTSAVKGASFAVSVNAADARPELDPAEMKVVVPHPTVEGIPGGFAIVKAGNTIVITSSTLICVFAVNA